MDASLQPNTEGSSMDDKTRYGLTLLTTDNPVFCCFLLWASILVFKMLVMSVLTSVQRFRKKAYTNGEDPDVDRVRSAHLNDMENILPYFTMALIYICIDPNPTLACILFRVAAVARILHTLVYAVYPVPQPARGLSFFTMFVITIYMAFDVGVKMYKYI